MEKMTIAQLIVILNNYLEKYGNLECICTYNWEPISVYVRAEIPGEDDSNFVVFE